MTDSPTAAGAAPVRVFVLDDYAMIRRGLTELLAATDDLAVVGEASTAAEALRQVQLIQPDVALFDIVLPDGSGIDVCREVRSRFPDIICLLLTFHDDEEAQLAAVMAGAFGYVTKQIHGAGIIDSIRRAAAGKALMDPTATREMLDRLGGSTTRQAIPTGSSRTTTGLNSREQQILDLVADGATNATIAHQLSVPEIAVRTSVSTIFAKLGLARRLNAAALARQAHG